MESKQVSLAEAAGLISDGATLGLGGNTLHRAPMAIVRELVRQKKRNLHLIKTAGAHDIDLLCAGGCAAAVDAGFISYETQFGLAGHYRRAVQHGTVKANEHACYTVICGLRGAAAGVPFMPVRGLVVTDLLRVNPSLSVVEDPFGTGPVAVVQALRPDVAVIHVHCCDLEGNAVIEGPLFEDVLLVKAAKRVILTAERIVPKGSRELTMKKVDIPGFLVTAVIHSPKGAAPGACYGKYEPDGAALTRFAGIEDEAGLEAFLAQYNE